ncbi:TPA: phage tail spike protein [Clostridioides difficile]
MSKLDNIKGNLKLYDGNEIDFGHNGLGILKDATDAQVTEEINGIFELEFTYYVDSFLFEKLNYGMIVKADASPGLRGQLFRIYYISKELMGTIKVKAQHISYDLRENFIEKVEFEKCTCEQALNALFRGSTEQNGFVGHSNLTGEYSFSIECVNTYEAIQGTRGSVLDTFGNGAKIKRDNFNIYINDSIGESNNVLIAYKKNLVGLEAEYDIQDVVTMIYPYAQVDQQSDDTTESVKITLPEKYIESENIRKYPTRKIAYVDFTGEDVTNVNQLRNKAQKWFYNKKDLPSVNYKVDFIDLSQTENYKDYEILETVNMDDEVIVRDLRMQINATARVVKTNYDPIMKRYNSIEIGNLVNHFAGFKDRLNSIENTLGKVHDDLDDFEVDNGKFPDTLPQTSTLKANGLFATVQLEWSYENKNYYTYELYASQLKDFVPDTITFNNRIYSGQASAFLHEVKPVQTWYYRVRAGNTHGRFTEFSDQVGASTRKIADGAEYFEEVAIGHALIRDLDVDKVVAGRLKGTYIDAKNLSVTDGNGDITFLVDSFGNVSIKATNFTLKGKTLDDIIGTEIDAITQIEIFNKLTNNGQAKGIYLVGNELFINASYIKSGTIEGTYINAKNLTVRDNSGNVTFAVDSNGNVTIRAVSFSLQGQTIEEIATDISTPIAEREAESAVEAQTQRDIFNKLTNNGQTQGIYLENGRIYINASYIQSGTIACDRITSSSSNPFILLFEGNGAKCAIDASAQYGEGIGKAIRLKYNDNAYLYVSNDALRGYLNGVEIFEFGERNGKSYIHTGLNTQHINPQEAGTYNCGSNNKAWDYLVCNNLNQLSRTTSSNTPYRMVNTRDNSSIVENCIDFVRNSVVHPNIFTPYRLKTINENNIEHRLQVDIESNLENPISRYIFKDVSEEAGEGVYAQDITSHLAVLQLSLQKTLNDFENYKNETNNTIKELANRIKALEISTVNKN